MPDVYAAQAAIASLSAAFDLTKAIASVRDSVKMNAMVMDLQRQIIEAQQFSLAAQSDYTELLGKIAEFELEIERLKEWDVEAQNYVLTEVPTGAFVRILKENKNEGEDEVWLCAQCFENKKKSVLQYSGKIKGSYHVGFSCNTCGLRIQVEPSVKPGSWRARKDEIVAHRQSKRNVD